jgi:hypothetical protein
MCSARSSSLWHSPRFAGNRVDVSTRDVSLAVWAVGAIVWGLSLPSVRQAVGSLVRAALHWRILVPAIAVVAYISLVVCGLRNIGLWNHGLLKDTILWSLFSGLAFAFSAVQAQSELPTWRAILKDQLKAIILLEFVVDTYTFDLWVELLLIPTLVFIGLLDAVARLNPKHEHIAKATGFLQGAFGLAIVGFAVRRALAEPFPTARGVAEDLLLTPVLTLSLLPIVYLFFLVSAYEQLFLMLKLGDKMKSPEVWYAKRRLFRHLRLRPLRVRDFLKRHRSALLHARTRADIDHLLDATT